MIKLCVIYFLMAIPFAFFAQDCPDGSGQIYFETQDEVDQFLVDFPNCTRLESQLLINDDSGVEIKDLSPFNNLESVRGLSLRAISDPIIGGFINLKEIHGSLSVFQTNLTNLDFLSNVLLIDASENVTVRIEQNPLLEDMSGLVNVEPDSIYTIRLLNNPLLSICHYSFVCEMLSRPPPPIGNHRVQFNAVGCENKELILEQCDTPIEPPIDPVLCPITSRPGMQIDKKKNEIYDVMYLYGNERMKISGISYSTLQELVRYHKVEKDLIFNFPIFKFEEYCKMAKRIIQGESYDYDLPQSQVLELNENITMQEVNFINNFILTISVNESIKI